MDANETQLDRAVVARALDGHLMSAYQPIVDLNRGGVLGYEALLRHQNAQGEQSNLFSASEIFAMARRVGRVAEVEAAALTAALGARDQLPRDCLLFLNVGLEALADERVEQVLRAQGDLSGVVLELKEPTDEQLLAARELIDLCRDRGSTIAVVDPLLDPDRLDRMMLIGPTYFKLDRQLVAGISENNTKLAVIDSVRYLSERLGVGLIAQGIEQVADLRSLERIGVGFGQGYLLARPSTDRRFTSMMPSAVGADTPRSATAVTSVGRLIEAACELTEDELDLPLPSAGNGIEFEVLVSELREPLALLRRNGRRIESLSLTMVDDSASLQQAARVAMRRPNTTRFEPLVCVDQLGACTGVVKIERLMDALAGSERSTPRQLDSAGEVHHNRHTFDFNCHTPNRRRRR